MSRSSLRGLLAAPLLATALLVSACGGDDASEGASSSTTPAENAVAVVTTPTTPAETTPATTPEAEAKEEKKSKKADEATPTPEPAATTAPDPTPAAEQPEAPGKLRPSAQRAQTEVLKALTAMETCVTTTNDYGKCKSAAQVNKFGGNVVDSTRPKPTEVAVTRATKSSFKIIGTDKQGTRWVLTKYKSGQVTRKCKRANGEVCNPASW